MNASESDRRLRFEVAYNVRHLGGHRTIGGGATSSTIIRAASLHRLTPSGVGQLADAGVRTVVDFRSAAERERDPSPDLSRAGIFVIEAPVFDVDASPASLADQGAFPGFAAIYESMLESGRTAYRTLFEAIVDRPGRLLFHCAAGKDRTGVAAALLLQCAGVPDRDIVEDYAESEAELAPIIQEWMRRMRERGLDQEDARALLASNPADMEATLAHVREKWGDASGYVEDVGLSLSALSALKSALVA